MEDIHIFQLEGTDYEMGKKQGNHFKASIHQMFEELTHSEEFLASKPFLVPKFLFIKLATWFSSKMIAEPIKEHLPSQWEFLRGLSEGANISMKRLLFLQAIDALGTQISNYKTVNGVSFTLNHCSAVGITGNRTNTGSPLIVKNWDGPPTLANHIIFRRLQPEGEKYATLGSGVGGLAGNNNGINDRGLSIVYNYAYPLEIGKSGVPPMFLIREILEQCDSVKGSVELLEQFPRLGGANIMIADKNGDLAVVETSSDRIEVRREGENGEKDFLICTNHYISPKMKENEVPRNSVYTENAPEYLQGKPVHKSSILRYKSAYEILKNQGLGTVTLDYLNQNIQCNHGPENKPSEYTFCNHGEQISTGFGVMIDVHNKEFYAIFGKPCQGEMQNLSQHL